MMIHAPPMANAALLQTLMYPVGLPKQTAHEWYNRTEKRRMNVMGKIQSNHLYKTKKRLNNEKRKNQTDKALLLGLLL